MMHEQQIYIFTRYEHSYQYQKDLASVIIGTVHKWTELGKDQIDKTFKHDPELAVEILIDAGWSWKNNKKNKMVFRGGPNDKKLLKMQILAQNNFAEPKQAQNKVDSKLETMNKEQKMEEKEEELHGSNLNSLSIPKACKIIPRPKPVQLTVRKANGPTRRAFVNTGLLIRIKDNSGIGHGYCTATLLDDGITLLTAAHCVGYKKVLTRESEEKHDLSETEFRFEPADGAKAIRFCPIYSSSGQKQEGSILLADQYENCPFVEEMYVLEGWRDQLPASDFFTEEDRTWYKIWEGLREDWKKTGNEEAKKQMEIVKKEQFKDERLQIFEQYELQLSQRLEYDVAVLKLEKAITKYDKKFNERGRNMVQGIKWQYIPSPEITQLLSNKALKETVKANGRYEAKVPDLDIVISATSLFNKEANYQIDFNALGYPSESNNELFLWSWNADYKQIGEYPHCMEVLNANLYGKHNKEKKNLFGKLIAFPLKTNHGASGGPLIVQLGKPAEATLIGVLSSGSREKDKERTNFRIIDEQIATFIKHVGMGEWEQTKYNSKRKKGDPYRIFGWKFVEKNEGFGIYQSLQPSIVNTIAAAQINEFNYYNYDDIYYDGSYGVPQKEQQLSFTQIETPQFESSLVFGNNVNIAIFITNLLALIILCCCICGVAFIFGSVFGYIFANKMEKESKQKDLEQV